MYDMMKKMKKGKDMTDVEKDAKMSVVKAMKKMAEDQMGGKLHGLKKVTVAAPDQEGLEEGLEKAQDLVEGQEEMMEEDEEMSEDEINAELERLMKLKNKMKGE